MGMFREQGLLYVLVKRHDTTIVTYHRICGVVGALEAQLLQMYGRKIDFSSVVMDLDTLKFSPGNEAYSAMLGNDMLRLR
jgi:predicted membrane protein